MKKTLFSFCLVLTALFSFSQAKNNICTNHVFIQETGISLDSFEVGKTYKNKYYENPEDTIISKVKDCFGSCDFKVVNKYGQVVLIGSYCGDGVLTSQDINIYSSTGEISGTRNMSWYVPKQCGVWTYFDGKGNKEKEEKY